MGFISWFKSSFLYVFRELILYHNSSLEFRAKVLASVVSVDKEIDECEFEILKEIASNTYPNNIERQLVLINTIKEYFGKVVEKNGLNVYELLEAIEKILKTNRRFVDKIDIAQLKSLRDCKKSNEEIYMLQTRVIEFLINRKKEYS